MRGCARAKTQAVTDREGYFRIELKGSFRRGWNDVDLELLHPAPAQGDRARPGAGDRRPASAVISDIDDTVVTSNVTSKTADDPDRGAHQRAHAQAVQGRGGVLPRAARRREPGVLRLEKPLEPVRADRRVPRRAGVAAGAGDAAGFWLSAGEGAQAQDHRRNPDHLSEAQVRAERRQRRAGSGDLRRHRAALSGSRTRDLHTVSEPETRFRDSGFGGRGRQDGLPAGARRRCGDRGGARRG